MWNERERLTRAVENALSGTGVKYIICDDLLEIERYEEFLVGEEYLIQQFGNYYVAFIF